MKVSSLSPSRCNTNETNGRRESKGKKAFGNGNGCILKVSRAPEDCSGGSRHSIPFCFFAELSLGDTCGGGGSGGTKAAATAASRLVEALAADKWIGTNRNSTAAALDTGDLSLKGKKCSQSQVEGEKGEALSQPFF